MVADTSLSMQVDCVVLVDPVTQSFAYVVLLYVRVASPFARNFVKNAVLWAVDPWRLGVQVGEELAAVEMSPLPFGGVVVDRKLELAGRAGEAVLPRVVDPHIDRPPSAESSTRLTSHGVTRPSR